MNLFSCRFGRGVRAFYGTIANDLLKYSSLLAYCFLHSDVFGVPAYGKRSLSDFGPFCERILGEKKNKEK